MAIVSVIEGDRVVEVAYDDPALTGQQVAIMDYDTDRAEPWAIRQVTQSDGTTSGAVGRLLTIVRPAIDLASLYETLDPEA